MKKLSLFEYAILWHPSEEERKEGKKSKIIVSLDSTLAVNNENAGLFAATKIPDDYKECLDQIEVVVRPF